MSDVSITRRALAAMALVPFAGRAQAGFPTRPIRWVIGYPAGGASDVVARILTQGVASRLGQPVIVDNRPGAATVLAAEYVAKAAPDGYTVMTVDMATMVYNRALYRRLPYNPERDLRPVAMYGRFDFILAVHPSVPAGNAVEFVAHARERPGALSYASPGVGSPHHLGMERFCRVAGISLTHVPYRGGAPAMTDLAAGTVQAMMVDLTLASPHLNTPRLRALAAATPRRVAELPDLPTLAESGFPGAETQSWHGLVAPAATPDDVVQRLADAVIGAVRSEDFQRRMRELSGEPLIFRAAEFQAVIAQQAATVLPLIAALGISLE